MFYRIFLSLSEKKRYVYDFWWYPKKKKIMEKFFEEWKKLGGLVSRVSGQEWEEKKIQKDTIVSSFQVEPIKSMSS